MKTTGEAVTKNDLNAKTVPELLNIFVVGTEKMKEWKQRSKRAPKP